MCAALAVLSSCTVTNEPPTEYVDLYDRAVNEFQVKNYSESRALLQRLLLEYPGEELNDSAKLRLATCDFMLGNVEAARAAYREFIEDAGPLRRQALEDLGNLEIVSGNFEQAAGYLRRAESLATTMDGRSRIRYRLGLALQQGGSFDEAREIFRELASSTVAGWSSRARPRLCLPDFFTVQVGAYGQRSNADAQRVKLDVAGFPAFVHAPDPGCGALFKVWVGRYRSRADADRVKERIDSSGVMETGAGTLVIP